ncbi:septin-6-like [Sycon ciliatum]|uniref:septin-6-like n=1 Tax=Sycon ciliatum TaxID=27933 RepID=UPI0031F64406
MDTLFKADLADNHCSELPKGVTLEENTYHLKESQVNLQLTVIDTVGYGDQVEKTDSAGPVVEYIEKQFDRHLQEELRIQRNLHQFRDTRIHVCIYFISPTGHSLKALDIKCMQQLQSRVNIIPVISKADTIAKNELQRFKKRIIQDLEHNGIQIYRFPTDDKTVAEINEKMNAIMPFAVIGSRDEIEINGQKVRARLYPWGTVEVENESHCDFIQLREMLIRTNMEDLRESTHAVHYETFRRSALKKLGYSPAGESDEPVRLSDLLQTKREEHLKEMSQAEENMKIKFVEKVSAVETQLKKQEKEIYDKMEALKKMVTEKRSEMEETKAALEDEIAAFRQHRSEAQTAQAQAAKAQQMEKEKRKK